MKLFVSIIYVAVLGILAHYIGESMPRRWFCESEFPYCAYSWERNGKIYEYLGIKKWKTKVPDMSRIMKDMLPKRVTFSATSESVTVLIKETCVAEFIHHSLSVFAIGIYFIWKNETGIALVFVFFICNAPFIIIQRYNRPHLIMLRNRMLRREERKRIANTNTVM